MLMSWVNPGVRVLCISCSKAFALTWYRALTWYCSPARPFAAPDVPLLVTGQQGIPTPACRQLSRARNACAGGSNEESTKFKHGTKLGRTLCYIAYDTPLQTSRAARWPWLALVRLYRSTDLKRDHNTRVGDECITEAPQYLVTPNPKRYRE